MPIPLTNAKVLSFTTLMSTGAPVTLYTAPTGKVAIITGVLVNSGALTANITVEVGIYNATIGITNASKDGAILVPSASVRLRLLEGSILQGANSDTLYGKCSIITPNVTAITIAVYGAEIPQA